jgi:hypothetical protein
MSVRQRAIVAGVGAIVGFSCAVARAEGAATYDAGQFLFDVPAGVEVAAINAGNAQGYEFQRNRKTVLQADLAAAFPARSRSPRGAIQTTRPINGSWAICWTWTDSSGNGRECYVDLTVYRLVLHYAGLSGDDWAAADAIISSVRRRDAKPSKEQPPVPSTTPNRVGRGKRR